MTITRSILKLEKCNGYQNLQKNISNYVIFVLFLSNLNGFWVIYKNGHFYCDQKRVSQSHLIVQCLIACTFLCDLSYEMLIDVVGWKLVGQKSIIRKCHDSTPRLANYQKSPPLLGLTSFLMAIHPNRFSWSMNKCIHTLNSKWFWDVCGHSLVTSVPVTRKHKY